MSVVEMTEQPKPKFTIIDLAEKLTSIYTSNINALKTSQEFGSASNFLDYLKKSNEELQELVAIVEKHKNDLEPIDMPLVNNVVVQEMLNTEKPAFSVCGVQLIQDNKLVGTSLYSTIVKGRMIRDTLNKKFAELKVNHYAKILNYPVF